MDDHESANNSREMSAQNNQPEFEGMWSDRKAAAAQAFKEWMPVSETPWGSYDIGGLATLFRTESRLIARSDEPEIDALFKAANPAAALAAFRDGPLQDPARTMLGTSFLVVSRALDNRPPRTQRIRTARSSRKPDSSAWGFSSTIFGLMGAVRSSLLRRATTSGMRVGLNRGVKSASSGVPAQPGPMVNASS